VPAMCWNLARAQQKWAIVSIILVREGATPRVAGYFYGVVAQAVLQYGSETWVYGLRVWTKSMMLALQGFHHKWPAGLPEGSPSAKVVKSSGGGRPSPNGRVHRSMAGEIAIPRLHSSHLQNL